MLRDLRRWPAILAETRALLAERYGIEHATLQPESAEQVVRLVARGDDGASK